MPVLKWRPSKDEPFVPVGVTLPSPEDIGAAKAQIVQNITLVATDWNDNAQTITVEGVLADEMTQIITPTPALVSQAAYYKAGIKATGQAENSLTFTCNTVPSEDLIVRVILQEVSV